MKDEVNKEISINSQVLFTYKKHDNVCCDDSETNKKQMETLAANMLYCLMVT